MIARKIFVVTMPHVTPEIGLLNLVSCCDGERPIVEIDGWQVAFDANQGIEALIEEKLASAKGA